MSLSIKGKTISLTRGDSAYLDLHIYNKDGSVYEMQIGDALWFAVKKDANDSTYAIAPKAVGNDMVLTINPSDTSSLDFGTYYYDVQLKNSMSGYVNTIIPISKFIINEEINS